MGAAVDHPSTHDRAHIPASRIEDFLATDTTHMRTRRAEQRICCRKFMSARTTSSYGNYVSRVATAPLAITGRNGRLSLSRPQWPVMIQDGSERKVPDARFMVSIARREEKGSDVNVASHLLIDVIGEGRVRSPASRHPRLTYPQAGTMVTHHEPPRY